MRTPVSFIPFILVMSALTSCEQSPEESSSVVESIHGNMPDGQEVKLFTLTNANGMVAKVTEYGAILDSIT
ncbi:MAG: galactose-1-epimerase, partial [Verrucomicrobiota bacterium]